MHLMIEALVSGLFIGKQFYPQLEFDLEGIMGDKHRGFTKDSDVRDKPLPKKVLVQNWRQWSGVSQEELAVVAKRLDRNWIGIEKNEKYVEVADRRLHEE